MARMPQVAVQFCKDKLCQCLARLCKQPIMLMAGNCAPLQSHVSFGQNYPYCKVIKCLFNQWEHIENPQKNDTGYPQKCYRRLCLRASLLFFPDPLQLQNDILNACVEGQVMCTSWHGIEGCGAVPLLLSCVLSLLIGASAHMQIFSS